MTANGLKRFYHVEEKQMRYWFIGVLLMIGNGACASSVQTILVLGDSLSAAYGMKPEQGWVHLLEERLKEQPFNIVNASISGETTAGGKNRLPKLLQQYQPTWVLIELGANDGLRGLSLKAMQNNLEQLVQLCQQHHAIPVIIGIKIPDNYGQPYTDKFLQVYQSVVQQYQLTFVPFLLEGIALVPQFFQNDGIHPTAAAQPYLLDNVWKQLQPLLQLP
ncbi:MAG: hypothetical protein RIT27_2440 [Pseudomonadota bacterium]|jgi:acyl-CoA thioesterase-1